jgi:hypothetical protein
VKCVFCDNTYLLVIKGRITADYFCDKCPETVFLHYVTPMIKTPIYAGHVIELKQNDKIYHMEFFHNATPPFRLQLMTKYTSEDPNLYYPNKLLANQILTLNTLPDINPSNARHWLDRLLNIKAFS